MAPANRLFEGLGGGDGCGLRGEAARDLLEGLAAGS